MSASEAVRRHLPALVPAIGWIRGYERAWWPRDLSAGAVVAVLLVPQGLAYAALAGMPPITGLYASMVPLVVYAALGSSTYVSVGPSAISALLVASSLGPFAAPGSARYVALAGLLALLTGGIRMVMGLLRLGALSNFLAQPVIAGFTSAAAIIIAVGQLGALFGIETHRSDRIVAAVRSVLEGLGAVQPSTLAVGLGSVAGLVLLRRLAPRFPAALAVAAVATTVSWVLGLDERGVEILGRVPPGLPSPELPPLDVGVARRLLPAALTLALVGYVEALSVAKELASRARQRVRPSQELLALGGACCAAGLFRGFPIGGSLRRTAVNYDAGARTPLASVCAGGMLAVVLLALTPLLGHLPMAVLAAIVIVAVSQLFEVRQVTEAFRSSRWDGAALLITFGATLVLPVEYGLLVGVVFTLFIFLYRSTHPGMIELGRVEGTDRFRRLERDEVHHEPQVALLRMDGPLYFMNAESFRDRVQRLWSDRPGVETVVLDTSAITGLDATGVETLRALIDQAAAAGLELHLATVRGPFRRVLERTGLLLRLDDRVHADLEAALAAVGRPQRREHPER